MNNKKSPAKKTAKPAMVTSKKYQELKKINADLVARNTELEQLLDVSQKIVESLREKYVNKANAELSVMVAPNVFETCDKISKLIHHGGLSHEGKRLVVATIIRDSIEKQNTEIGRCKQEVNHANGQVQNANTRLAVMLNHEQVLGEELNKFHETVAGATNSGFQATEQL